MTRALTLVRHATDAPALDAMFAGMIAAAIDARLVTLDTGGGGLGAYEACQHALASGALGANGLFWSEWASDCPVGAALPPAVIVRLPDAQLVVSVNAAVPAQAEMAERLLRKAPDAGRTLREITAHEADDHWFLTGDLPAGFPAEWGRDGFGRPCPRGAEPAAPLTCASLLLVGSEHRLRQTYPAVLAALGDAAEARALGLDLSFWDPAEAPPESLPAALAACDGIVLPGGADMEQVAGQIRVARHAIARDVPLLGLCLGMQTLTTAVAQLCAGFNDANMEEAAPEAVTKVFRRLTQDEIPGAWRIGHGRMQPVPHTRLASLVGAAPVLIPVNHRYVLDPALHAPLERAGLEICGWQAGNALADAVELPDRRFCLGLQGHPELLTRRGAPHPLFLGFLDAFDTRLLSPPLT